MENHHFSWENPLEMVIFNSYVKLPEGTFHIDFLPEVLQIFQLGAAEARYSGPVNAFAA